MLMPIIYKGLVYSFFTLLMGAFKQYVPEGCILVQHNHLFIFIDCFHLYKKFFSKKRCAVTPTCILEKLRVARVLCFSSAPLLQYV